MKKSENMKYFRLKKQSDFQKLFSSGKRAFSPSLTVVYKKSQAPIMGVSVGKKHGKSVQRNKIKRLIREAYRSVLGEMQGTYSMVLIPKVAQEYKFVTFQKHLKWIIKKENL